MNIRFISPWTHINVLEKINCSNTNNMYAWHIYYIYRAISELNGWNMA